MEPSFQTSFIPKKPLETDRVVGHRSMGLLFFISMIVVVCVCLLSAGLFLYKNLLTNQKASLSDSLSLSRNGFEQATIDELNLFDKRTAVAKQILASHFALSPLFTTLNSITIPSVQFTKFDNTSTDKSFSVNMSGVARDYTSIAVQAQVFNSDRGRYFKNVIFSNLVLSDSPLTKGYVSFNLSFDVDPGLLSYEKNVILQKSTPAIINPSNSNYPISNQIQTPNTNTPSTPSNINPNQTQPNVTPPSSLPNVTPTN